MENKKSYFKRLLILPVGSYEYHGEELTPLTDIIIAEGVSKGLAKAMSSTFNQLTVLPTVNYGLAIEHTGQPNTAIITHNVFYSYVFDIVSSVAKPNDLIVIINGHGGNVFTCQALEGHFNSTFQDRKVFFPTVYAKPVKELCNRLVKEFEVHAGSVEASLVAFYMGTKERKYQVRIGPRVRGSLRFFQSREISPEGVIAQHSTVIADPAIGEKLHDAIIKDVAESVNSSIDSMNIILAK